MPEKPVKLIPYTCGAGASRPGGEGGVAVLKRAGLDKELGAAWQEDPEKLFASSPFGAEFHKNLPPRGTPERREAVLWHDAHIRDAVIGVIKSGAFPVTLGGDHSMAVGSISGLAQAHKAHGRIGLIWVDAHADLNTPDTSPSQAFHGMPLAALLGMGDPGYTGVGGGTPVLKPENVYYLGLRDVDPGEEDYLGKLNIGAARMADIRKTGFAAAFKKALDTVSKNTDYVAISIDLDAFDPAEVTSIGSPVPGGLLRDEVFPVLAEHRERFDLIEIAEFNPAFGDFPATALFVTDLLKKILT